MVVCTYNHARLLPGVFDALRRQTVAESLFEIIVVDNNSTDDTRAVVAALGRDRGGVRYQFEPAQGIAHARNCGWRHARGRYVAYLDDDCRPPKAWLATAVDIAERLTPMVIGGPYHTVFDGPRPRWAGDTFNSFVPLREPHFLGHDECAALVGGNVFVRRDVFDAVGGFDPRLGHVGTTPAYGEETAMFAKIHARYPRSVYYDPRLYVDHVVRPDKLTLWYGVRSAFGAGRSAVRRQAPSPSCTIGRLILDAGVVTLALVADVLVGTVLRDRRAYPCSQSYVRDHSLHYVRRLGSLYEQLGPR